MLWPNDVKEELSLTFIHGVATRAGFAVEQIRKDRDSIDLKIVTGNQLASDSTVASAELAVQMKATARKLHPEMSLHCDLPIKNYADLIKKTLVPRILVLFILPEDEQQWIETSEEALVLRHCAFWMSLLGKPASTNTDTQRVHLLRSNILNPATLRDLLTRVSREQEL